MELKTETIERISASKIWFFRKTNKTNTSKQEKEKENTYYQYHYLKRRVTITDPRYIKRLIMKY